MQAQMSMPLRVIIIILILVVGSIILFGGRLPFSIGFSTLSLSKVDYVSNDPDVGGEAWLMELALTGSGESAQGTFTANLIQDQADNFKATQDFTLTSKVSDNKIEYTIQNDFTQFYTVGYYKVTVGILNLAEQQRVDSECRNNPNFLTIQAQVALTGVEYFCFLKNPSGTKGIVRDDFKRIFSANITTTKAGVPTTVTINTIESTSARLGDFGFVKWVGFLVTDVAEPTPGGQDVCALYNNGWKLIDCSDFQTWSATATKSVIDNCMETQRILKPIADAVLFCQNQVNNAASLVLQGKEFTAIGGSGEKFTGATSGTLDAGKVTINLPRLYIIPLLTVKLKTSYIGKVQIVVPVGKPDIIQTKSDCFGTGAANKGFISVTVKNIGTAMSATDVSAVCTSPFSSNDRIRLNINPGETDIALLAVTASVNQETRSTCTVKAIDINNPANTDTAQVEVCATQIQVCNPGTKKVEGRNVLQCNAAGSGFDIIQTCAEDQVADALTFQCVNKIQGAPLVSFPDITGGITGGITAAATQVFFGIVIILILIIVIVVVAYLISRRF